MSEDAREHRAQLHWDEMALAKVIERQGQDPKQNYYTEAFDTINRLEAEIDSLVNFIHPEEEYMEPCRNCKRTDLPLHIDRLCPECHVLTDEDHQGFVADLDYESSTLTIRMTAKETQALEVGVYENGQPIFRRSIE